MTARLRAIHFRNGWPDSAVSKYLQVLFFILYLLEVLLNRIQQPYRRNTTTKINSKPNTLRTSRYISTIIYISYIFVPSGSANAVAILDVGLASMMLHVHLVLFSLLLQTEQLGDVVLPIRYQKLFDGIWPERSRKVAVMSFLLMSVASIQRVFGETRCCFITDTVIDLWSKFSLFNFLDW